LSITPLFIEKTGVKFVKKAH